MQYPTTLYHDNGTYRVTFSPEEHAKLKGDGYADDPKEGVEYRVYHATPKAKPAKPVKAE
jgi:hypothetical protein